jgi:hypothetical protein
MGRPRDPDDAEQIGRFPLEELPAAVRAALLLHQAGHGHCQRVLEHIRSKGSDALKAVVRRCRCEPSAPAPGAGPSLPRRGRAHTAQRLLQRCAAAARPSLCATARSASSSYRCLPYRLAPQTIQHFSRLAGGAALARSEVARIHAQLSTELAASDTLLGRALEGDGVDAGTPLCLSRLRRDVVNELEALQSALDDATVMLDCSGDVSPQELTGTKGPTP